MEVEVFDLGAFELVGFVGVAGVAAGAGAIGVVTGAVEIGLVVRTNVGPCE